MTYLNIKISGYRKNLWRPQIFLNNIASESKCLLSSTKNKYFCILTAAWIAIPDSYYSACVAALKIFLNLIVVWPYLKLWKDFSVILFHIKIEKKSYDHIMNTNKLLSIIVRFLIKLKFFTLSKVCIYCDTFAIFVNNLSTIFGL